MDYLNTFLSLNSPASIIGATLYITESRTKVGEPYANGWSYASILLWVAELGALFFSYYMADLLYQHSQQEDDDSVFQTSSVFLLIKFIWVAIFVVINLLAGSAFGVALSIQKMLFTDDYWSMVNSGKFKGSLTSKIVLALSEIIITLVLPLIGFIMVVDRLSNYTGVCKLDDVELTEGEETLIMETLDAEKDLSMGTYYAWSIIFYGIALGIRIIRSVLLASMFNTTGNNIVSYPTRSLQGNKIGYIIKDNKLTDNIQQNARVEVTYNLDKNQNAWNRRDLM